MSRVTYWMLMLVASLIFICTIGEIEQRWKEWKRRRDARTGGQDG